MTEAVAHIIAYLALLAMAAAVMRFAFFWMVERSNWWKKAHERREWDDDEHD